MSRGVNWGRLEESAGGWWLAIESSNPNVMVGDAAGGDALRLAARPVQGQVAVAKVRAGAGVEGLAEFESAVLCEWIQAGSDALGRSEDDLPGAVARCLGRAGIAMGDLRGVGVSVGPGGFTSVRSACMYGAMVAEGVAANRHGARCLIAGVPTAAVCAVTMGDELASTGSGPVVVAMASKGAQAWCCVLPERAELIARDACGWARAGKMMGASEVAGLGVQCVVAAGHVPDEIGRGVPRLAMRLSAEGVLRLVLACCEDDAARLQPIYPREPEAVSLWKKRAGGGKG